MTSIEVLSRCTVRRRERFQEQTCEQALGKSGHHFTTLVKRGGKAFFNRKVALVERLNRTLKTIMWKYFAEHFKERKDERWLDILADVTFNYNNSVNKRIKMRPNDVTQENKDEVWMTLYGNDASVTSKPKYKVGDIMPVEKYHPETRFVKGYTINFTNELFKIVRMYRGDPVMYGIQDVETGEDIRGRFYERELSIVA